MHSSVASLLLFQLPLPGSPTTPPSRDTVGYWQQRVRYEIEATLDEPRGGVAGRAVLVYVNNSPDTLREMYVQVLTLFGRDRNGVPPTSVRTASVPAAGRPPLRTALPRHPPSTCARRAETLEKRSTVVRFACPPLVLALAAADFVWTRGRPPFRVGRCEWAHSICAVVSQVAVYDREDGRRMSLVPPESSTAISATTMLRRRRPDRDRSERYSGRVYPAGAARCAGGRCRAPTVLTDRSRRPSTIMLHRHERVASCADCTTSAVDLARTIVTRVAFYVRPPSCRAALRA